MRMEAYYYEFKPTGVELVDRILSAVASAGKSYHHTEDWNDAGAGREDFLRGDTPIDWIQNAANDAAAAITDLQEQVPAPPPED